MLTPDDETVQNFRIQIYRDQGKLDQALRELQELVQRDPRNKFYLASYALVLLQMERYDDAIAEYEKALQLDPQYDVALFNAAAALKTAQRKSRKKNASAKSAIRSTKKTSNGTSSSDQGGRVLRPVSPAARPSK